MNINQIRNLLEQKRGQRNQVLLNKKKTEKDLFEAEKEAKYITQAKEIIQEVALSTQRQFSVEIDNIVSLAIKAAFKNPYKFHSQFNIKRGKTEMNLLFERNNRLLTPQEDCSGGVCDVASFALRMGMMSLSAGKSVPVIALDEPFKNINDSTRETHRRIAKMVREISDALKCQVIMVSLLPELLEIADNVIFTEIEDGVTMVQNNSKSI